MKKLLIIIIIIVFGLTSCSDYLDEEVFSSSQTSNFYQNEQQGISALNGAYAGLRDTYFDFKNDFTFMEMLEGPTGTVELNGGYANMNFGSKELRKMGGVWDRIWVGVNRSSTLIRLLKTKNINEESSKRILAEAKFVRALSYFHIVRIWGSVPIMNGVTSIDEAYPDKAPESEVYKLIIQDLKTAAQDLPKWNDYSSSGAAAENTSLSINYQRYEAGRATQGAAQALLAKVYLTIASSINSNANSFENAFDMNEMYTNARDMCALVYDGNHGYGLIDNYFDIYQENNEYGKEDIFSIGFKQATEVKVGNSLASVTGIKKTNILAIEIQRITANPDFLDEFEDADERKEATFVLRYIDKKGEMQIYKSKKLKKLGFKKYWSDYQLSPDNIPMERTTYVYETSTFQKGVYGDNIPVLRYSEVLLMYAEALHALGDESQAMERLADVRERANLGRILPAGDFMELLISERRRELCFEMKLWFDYQRLNIVGNYRPDLADEKYKYFPLPVGDLMTNPGLLPQNPGW
jgi:hypothetical protein